jgi:hypothetical protein
MQTAGVALDFYDDAERVLFRELFPAIEAVPDLVKQAHVLTEEEIDALRPEAFAVVLVNDGVELKKFACVDPGNTFLSAAYFQKVAQLLPQEVQEVAGKNIALAVEEFGLAEELQKRGLDGMSRWRDPKKKKTPSEEADWKMRTNIETMTGGTASEISSPTSGEVKQGAVEADSALGSGTDDTRNIMPGYPSTRPALQSHDKVVDPAAPFTGTAGASSVNYRHVNVTHLKPKKIVEKEKKAAHYALGEKYPLDSMRQVLQAIDYFETYKESFSPRERHEYAVKTASRVDELCLEMTPSLERYGSTEYAPDVNAHLLVRLANCPENVRPIYEQMQEKLASLEPEEMATLLEATDKLAGFYQYNSAIPDPYFTVFGGWAEKEKKAHWSWMGPAGEYISAKELKILANNGRPTVHRIFSSDLANAFCLNPIGTFEKLPLEQKKIMVHMASTHYENNALN